MARNRRSSRRSSNPRRRLFWAQFSSVLTAGPTTAPVPMAPQNLLETFEDDYGADLFGFTVTRIRGLIRFAYDQTTVVERHDVSFGIRIAAQSSVENADEELEQLNLSPAGDPHSDWMWVYNDTHYTHLDGSPQYAEYPVEVDIRAQRRLDELGQSLFMFGAFANADLESFVNMTLNLRVLCKRP